MADRKLRAANRQRGSALILVLIALALGSLIITPTLNYVYTGLSEMRITEERLSEQYTADAAVEYALWQLSYNVDGITDGLSMDNPSAEGTVTINGIEVPVTTEISFSPESDEGSFTVPGSQSGIHLTVALDILPLVWTKAGNKAHVTHVVYIYNYGTAAVHLKALFQRLDPRFSYVQQTYFGPSATLRKTLVDEARWELLWEFNQPQPKVDPGEMMSISFITVTKDNKDMGEETYSGSGWVEYAAFQEDAIENFSGDSGTASFGLYDITVTVGSCTVRVNVGVTEEGEIVIRSYQIE